MTDDYEPMPVDLEWADLVAELLAAPSLDGMVSTVQRAVMDRDMGADEKAPHARALVRLVLVRDRVGALNADEVDPADAVI